MRVLTVNAGSSSVKLSLLDAGRTLAARELPAPQAAVDVGLLRAALEDGLGEADAVGHRIVHGGQRFRDPVVIDGEVVEALRELVDLAPLHQPKSLAALDGVSHVLPGVPAVACFDTAFHASLPPAAHTYALPRQWAERWGIRRYGFHGLSHAWVARRAPELLGLAADEARIVSCHLGAGASLCAIAAGRSIDTTMGFTPLEGVVMATRSGSVDPGLLLWLLERETLTVMELASALEHQSGLLGMCGTGDMPEVLSRARGADEHAVLALSVYLHRLRTGIGAMTAALGGIDILTFTGGIGARSAEIRARTVDGLEFLGVTIDEQVNAAVTQDTDIASSSSRVRVPVIETREDLEIAQQVQTLLTG